MDCSLTFLNPLGSGSRMRRRLCPTDVGALACRRWSPFLLRLLVASKGQSWFLVTGPSDCVSFGPVCSHRRRQSCAGQVWVAPSSAALPRKEAHSSGRNRRTGPGGILAGATPLLDPPALEHLAAAVASARRYADRHLVAHLRTALDEAARTDGRTGPRQALPAALGILGAIDEIAREAVPTVRRELLVVGARAAEFTAWLHRDAGDPPHIATFFHDRAIEWATFTGDGPMHAYVLLRKAQATDRDDAARMRDLAQAAVHGPWTLPPRAQAEALQQEARAMVLTGTAPDVVARTLDEAHDALGDAPPAEPAPAPARCAPGTPPTG